MQNLTSGKAFKAAIGLWLVSFAATVLGLGPLHELAYLGAKVSLLVSVVLLVFPMATGATAEQQAVEEQRRE